jgi:hypothetical protein
MTWLGSAAAGRLRALLVFAVFGISHWSFAVFGISQKQWDWGIAHW